MDQVIAIFQEQLITIITTIGVGLVAFIKRKLDINSKEFKTDFSNTIKTIENNNEQLVKNVSVLTDSLSILTNKVDKLYNQFEVKVVSNNVLKKKFLAIVETFDYNENSESTDIFKVFMKKILTWVADYYTELNESNAMLGYKEKEEIIKYINQLYNTETISINITKVNDLALKLLNDYTINKSEDSNYNFNLILDLTKVLIEQSYKIYKNGK